MCLIPCLCNRLSERAVKKDTVRGASQASHTLEHSSVFGSACNAYLNWWQAISGCHAIAFHIIVSPPPPSLHWLSLALPHSNFLCLSHSLFFRPPMFSTTTSLYPSPSQSVSPQFFQGDLLAVVYLVWIPTGIKETVWCLMPAVQQARSHGGCVQAKLCISCSITHTHAHAKRYCVSFKRYRECL